MPLIRCAFNNVFFLQRFPTFSLVLKNLVGRRFLMLVSALGMAVAQVHLPIACLIDLIYIMLSFIWFSIVKLSAPLASTSKRWTRNNVHSQASALTTT